MIDNFFKEITGENATTGMFLRNARKRAELTQAQVSKITGIKVTSISKYENDKLEMGASVALRFAALYKISPLTLLYPNGIKAELDFLEVANVVG